MSAIPRLLAAILVFNAFAIGAATADTIEGKGNLSSGVRKAYAEITVQEYWAFMKDGGSRPSLETYIQGVGRGYFIMNKTRGANRQQTFCVPRGFVPEGEDFLRWVENAARIADDDDYIEVLLLIHMITQFPCN